MEMQSKNAVTQQTLKDAKASRKQLKRNAEEAEVRYNEAKKAYNKVEQVRRVPVLDTGLTIVR